MGVLKNERHILKVSGKFFWNLVEPPLLRNRKKYEIKIMTFISNSAGEIFIKIFNGMKIKRV